MKKARLLIVVLLIVTWWMAFVALAHEKPIPVIVDTDLAADDVRAITLLLGNPKIQIVAIVTTEMNAGSTTNAQRVGQMLQYLGRPGIPIGAGRPLAIPVPEWRKTVDSLAWSALPSAKIDHVPEAKAVVRSAISGTKERLDYICLGPLTNLAETLRWKSFAKHIRGVWYYGAEPGSARPGWNTNADPGAAVQVFKAGIPIYSFHPRDEEIFAFDAELYSQICRLDSPPARLITLLFGSSEIQPLLTRHHLLTWDDTVALYAAATDLGQFERQDGRKLYHLGKWDKAAAQSLFLKMFGEGVEPTLPERMPVVLLNFPVAPEQFQEDLREVVPRIIAAHGIEEWKAAVLTNELHRHLGTYSIIGVKMGIAAREILKASLDELRVVSWAGSAPPLSCLNDGLQVATGASLGRGTIRVEENAEPRVEAEFSQGGRKVVLRLKAEVHRRIEADIRTTAERYGNLTEGYFKEVRRLSIRHWLELKRGEIFEVVTAAGNQ